MWLWMSRSTYIAAFELLIGKRAWHKTPHGHEESDDDIDLPQLPVRAAVQHSPVRLPPAPYRPAPQQPAAQHPLPQHPAPQRPAPQRPAPARAVARRPAPAPSPAPAPTPTRSAAPTPSPAPARAKARPAAVTDEAATVVFSLAAQESQR